jgi:circadian clock protein KaiC
MDEQHVDTNTQLVSTGITGLDDILHGGLSPNRIYLIEGDPGAGKTTLALRFLLEGAALGDKGLYVSLSETRDELTAIAASHGWSLEGIDVLELNASLSSLEPEAQYTVFHPSEVELFETTRQVLARVEASRPKRVVFDSLSEMRLLTEDLLRYRRQILALKQFFAGRHCTVLLLDDSPSWNNGSSVQSLVHGVVELQQIAPNYGSERRRLRIVKMRGRGYRGGYHDFRIRRGGLGVFPRVIAAEHDAKRGLETASSGVAELDALLGGGLVRGTTTLLLGPAGVGKSSVASQYVHAASMRGEPVRIFTFDESRDVALHRAAGLGFDFQCFLQDDLLKIQQVDPAEMTPGEFACKVRNAVEEQGARVVVIDSLNGYMNAMQDKEDLMIHLHELFSYLGQHDVTTILVLAQHGLLGPSMRDPIDVSYISDTVILFRYFEAAGAVRQAVSVLKKRTGMHERTIRELAMTSSGVQVGEPLHAFHGILTGVPTFQGRADPLLEK